MTRQYTGKYGTQDMYCTQGDLETLTWAEQPEQRLSRKRQSVDQWRDRGQQEKV